MDRWTNNRNNKRMRVISQERPTRISKLKILTKVILLLLLTRAPTLKRMVNLLRDQRKFEKGYFKK